MIMADGAGRDQAARRLDYRLQMGMLVTLIVLEILLIGGGLTYLHIRLGGVIESQLYRIHVAHREIFLLIWEEALPVLVVMLAVNLMGLLAADRIWVKYARLVLGRFTVLTNQVADLDLRVVPDTPGVHGALDQLLACRHEERERLLAIRRLLSGVEELSEEALAGRLHEMIALLPRSGGELEDRCV
ncbi:MAG: hypothetical protein HQL96_10690 [Magnetococcales bacterium]|nr:hypothetical protein [Magnetococcales bacterium]